MFENNSLFLSAQQILSLYPNDSIIKHATFIFIITQIFQLNCFNIEIIRNKAGTKSKIFTDTMTENLKLFTSGV